MIIIIQLIYWTIKHIYIRAQNKRVDNEKMVNDTFLEDIKVTCCPANIDAEAGLKFDPPVYCQRYSAVQQVLVNKNWRGKIKKVVDFGCAELNLFKYLKHLTGVEKVLCVDIDRELLQFNTNKVCPFNADYLCRRSEPLHVEILQGSVANPDPRLDSVDAVICIELIEHLYPDTLDALPHNIFQFIQPRVAIFTTPNADFNVLFPDFSGVRHYDHKFEWTRQQFEDWSRNLVVRYPKYSVSFLGIGAGPVGSENLGCCSQMAVFVKEKGNSDESKKSVTERFSSDSKNAEETEDCKLSTLSNYDVVKGVCTYGNFNSKTESCCAGFELLYKVIREVDYPYEVDNRTQEEKIQHETEYRIHCLTATTHRYFNHEKDRNEIPLYELTSNRGGEFISEPELRSILEKAGWTVEPCDVNGTTTLCAIGSDPSIDSDRSESPDQNLSTDVNWDSGSQWDLNSSTKDVTEVWEDMDLNPKPFRDNAELWEEGSSSGQNTENTVTNNSKSSEVPFESCVEDSPGSDPCVSGEQNGAGNERVELLFDSGYQVSTSSIELSPEVSKDWLTEEKKFAEETSKSKVDSESVRTSKSEKCYKHKDEPPKLSYPAGMMKSDGNIFKVRKRNKLKAEEPAPAPVPAPAPNRIPPIPAVVVVAPVPEPENPEIVENGDLANNNRDREGNNYQAAENLVEVDDNAVPRPQNLDEHNENHIVLEHHEPGDAPEDEDAAESLEDASREALYDANSERSFSEDGFLLQGEHIPVVEELNRSLTVQELLRGRNSSEESFHTPMNFPSWLLQLLNVNQELEGLDGLESAHFYSQGDGLGIHPSNSEVTADESSSSTSDSSHTSAATAETADTETNPNTTVNSVTSDGTSAADSTTYHDALDFVADSASASAPTEELDAPPGTSGETDGSVASPAPFTDAELKK